MLNPALVVEVGGGFDVALLVFCDAVAVTFVFVVVLFVVVVVDAEFVTVVGVAVFELVL